MPIMQVSMKDEDMKKVWDIYERKKEDDHNLTMSRMCREWIMAAVKKEFIA